MESIKKKFSTIAFILGLIMIVPMSGCREEAPQPENKPLTQKELEETLDRPSEFRKAFEAGWEEDQKELQAFREAHEKEEQRRAEQAKREYDELIEKKRQQKMKQD